MSISTDPYVWIAAILTLAVFSFLYEDNPLFCLAEHLLVGLASGYLLCTYWHNVLVPELIVPLRDHGLGSEAHLMGAAVICFFWTCKYIDRLEDLYRVALAFWVSIDMGMIMQQGLPGGLGKHLGQDEGEQVDSNSGDNPEAQQGGTSPMDAIGNAVGEGLKGLKGLFGN